MGACSVGSTVVVVGDEPRVKQGDYLANGKVPVVDQGLGLVGGFTDDESLSYRGPLPAIVFGDHTRRFKYLDFRFAVGAQGTKVLAPVSGLSPKFLYYQLLSFRIATEVTDVTSPCSATSSWWCLPPTSRTGSCAQLRSISLGSGQPRAHSTAPSGEHRVFGSRC